MAETHSESSYHSHYPLVHSFTFIEHLLCGRGTANTHVDAPAELLKESMWESDE